MTYLTEAEAVNAAETLHQAIRDLEDARRLLLAGHDDHVMAQMGEAVKKVAMISGRVADAAVARARGVKP